MKLQDVIAQASGQTWSAYFNAKLRDKIGMDGTWFNSGNNIVYGSTTRSMARFGLLMYNKGKWGNNVILNENYFNGHSATTNWYWASAGKTLTSTLTGIAQQENLININNKVFSIHWNRLD